MSSINFKKYTLIGNCHESQETSRKIDFYAYIIQDAQSSKSSDGMPRRFSRFGRALFPMFFYGLGTNCIDGMKFEMKEQRVKNDKSPDKYGRFGYNEC